MRRTAIVFVGFLVVLGMVGASAIAVAGGAPPGTEYWIAEGGAYPDIWGDSVFWVGDGIWMHDLGPDGKPFTKDDGVRQQVVDLAPYGFASVNRIRVQGHRIVFSALLPETPPPHDEQVFMADVTTGNLYLLSDPTAGRTYT